MSDDQPIRIGVLGAARIAPTALIQPSHLVDEVEVTAIAARNREKAERFAEEHGVASVHDSYDALLRDEKIDAVYVALPNSLHAEWSIRALEAGKHVLCEKPVAANAAEAEDMARAARESGFILCEAMHPRFHPLAARLKEIISGGDLGELQHVEAHMCIPLFARDPLRFSYELAGGTTMDVGCYAVSYLRHLVGDEPEVVKANVKLSSNQVDRYVRADLKFPNSVTGRVCGSLFSIVLFRIKVTAKCEFGEFHVADPFSPFKSEYFINIRTRDGLRQERVGGASNFEYQLRAFANAVREDGDLPTDSIDFIANMRVIDAVYQKAGLKCRGT